MRATKSEIEPLTYWAITLQASLAEATIAQYRRFSSVIVSCCMMYTLLPPTIMSKSNPGCAVTGSESAILPDSMSSTASRTVITFVSEAG